MNSQKAKSIVEDSATAALRSVLATVPFFDGIAHQELSGVASRVEWLTIPGGSTLFRQGEAADAVYVVTSGRLGVFVEDGDTLTLVEEITANQVVGEMALLTGQPRSATVIALRDTTLVRCPKTALEGLTPQDANSTLMLRVLRMLATRLEHATHDHGQRPIAKTFAVVPAATDVPAGEFTARLVRAFEQSGAKVHTLTAADAQRSADWLHRVEVANTAVFYQADLVSSTWAKLCMRQADRIVLVGRGGTRPPTSLAADLDAQTRADWSAPRDLVLLHDGGTAQPTGTAQWLSAANVKMHHHVRLHRTPDFERLARMLTGRAVGLVLSGGAARGGGHIGVIRALSEAGIPIDLVGGTSIGAIVAASVAHEWDHERILAKYQAAHGGKSFVGDYTLPIVALAKGRRLSRIFWDLYGNVRIEDLWRPMFCISSNLTTGRVAVHNTGPLSRWLRASASLPGVLPPVIEAAEVYVDGGVMNNLPVDVMARYARGPIIAVDVGTETMLSASGADPESLSWWGLLASQFARRGPNVPNILHVLWSAGMASMRAAVRSESQADLLLTPPLNAIDMLDWGAADRAAEIAYEYTCTRLAEMYASERALFLSD